MAWYSRAEAPRSIGTRNSVCEPSRRFDTVYAPSAARTVDGARNSSENRVAPAGAPTGRRPRRGGRTVPIGPVRVKVWPSICANADLDTVSGPLCAHDRSGAIRTTAVAAAPEMTLLRVRCMPHGSTARVYDGSPAWREPPAASWAVSQSLTTQSITRCTRAWLPGWSRSGVREVQVPDVAGRHRDRRPADAEVDVGIGRDRDVEAKLAIGVGQAVITVLLDPRARPKSQETDGLHRGTRAAPGHR